jgi:hypothetical protein
MTTASSGDKGSGGNKGGGGGKGGGGSPPNAPSKKPGQPSGPRRGNNPPKPK